ncbi:hypothetical protein RND71_017182 [Anisodus tanguticus]|uniref:Uncharacterized protein n=1 Tax=Anisodus tanguticus TaxID=243964 RepID=A0AAE1S3N5_9SOLA|nr:hypothetical protein RND71_017182 [Anisodus tanguticus]
MFVNILLTIEGHWVSEMKRKFGTWKKKKEGKMSWVRAVEAATYACIMVDSSLEGAEDYEIEEICQPNISSLRTGEEISRVKNSDGEVGAKGATIAKAKNEVESLITKPVAKASEDSEVLSYAHLPHSIARSNSFIASRPLYILLLTDLTIVIARIVRKEVVPDEERAEDRERGKDFRHNWDGALSILEYGLVLYQTIRAIFIDCSFYLVIVICGLSLI